MTVRMIDCRHTATSALPADVMNNNCVQGALCRLRQEMGLADSNGINLETDAAPEYLVKARSNLFAWIKEARDQDKARLLRRTA